MSDLDSQEQRKPGVLSLNIKERSALFAAYMSFLKNGGIFIPTDRPIKMGEEIFMLLTIMKNPDKIAVQGKVVWITPAHANDNRIQGVGVQFNADDGGKLAKRTIENNLVGLLENARSTHTL
ncbi:PilZ domain-containing protein [Neisseria sp. Ec49-e6-T10]|uniref:PilZ domain-containing protein n=1 Tax=Neisseria sp. Ec49-e6-T10 TaxID=3140744 RepID=UPI003EBC762A